MEILIALIAVFLTIATNLCAIAYFAGVLHTTQTHHKSVIEDIKEQFAKSIEDLKSQLTEDIGDLKKRQDKHNDIITRTFVLEEQMRVSNHRIEDLEDNR